ncbi:hypothetical protein CROQUDRAFT_530089 [Cronartium quercuum f. sp. fusiforme G11]|uniref:Uncharacterized protein n=1 Tax=Cronartium quercuum f. sp. fusiforme G11 TaxID=708437 RepID=A0A9P6NHS6_9BASI|nr:hypothetical protein CROQUDRAFT_530089 [Cronartium quercuum f. sp. fusiforme G11]
MEEDAAPDPQMKEEDILASKLIERLLPDEPDREVESVLSQYKKDTVIDFETLSTLRTIILSTTQNVVNRIDALKLILLKISPSEGTLRNSLRDSLTIRDTDMLSAGECLYFQNFLWEIIQKLSVHEELSLVAGKAYELLSDTLDLFWSTHLKTLIVVAESGRPKFWIKDYYTSALRSGTVRFHHSEYSLQTRIVRLFIRRKVGDHLEKDYPQLNVQNILSEIEAGVSLATTPKIKIFSSQIDAFRPLLGGLHNMDELSRQRVVLLLGYLAEDTVQISRKRKDIDQKLLLERCLNFQSMLKDIINQKIVGSREHKTLANYFLKSLTRRIENGGSAA